MNKKLIRLLSLSMAVIMLFSLCSCNSYDDEEKEIKYASAVPQTKGEILVRFNEVMASAKNGNPAISFSLDQGAGGADCENKYVKAAFKTVSKDITKESFGEKTEYGASSKDIFPQMGKTDAAALELNDIRSAVITDNETDDTYTILIKIYPETNPDQDNSVYGKIFKIEKDADILKNFDIVKHLMTADSYSATYGTGTIKAIIDKTSDHLVKLELHRDVRIETAVTGQGTLASVGTVPLAFDYNSTEKFDLDWDNPETDSIED